VGEVTLSRRAVIWLVPALLAVHNAEEALMFPRYLPLVRERVPDWARPIVIGVTYEQMSIALALATIAPLGVAIWAVARPRSPVAVWSVVLVQAVVLLNVAAHVCSALLILRGYGPGLATALVINLPFSLYVLRRAAREQWTTRQGLLALAPAAFIVHGPLLLGAIAVAGSLAR
jgi:hypothetical protein